MDTGSSSEHRKQNTEHRPIIFYITENGLKLAEKLLGLFPDAEIVKFNTSVFAAKWNGARKIVCIMASGIVVRTLSGLLRNKRTDPAVVVLDEGGRFAISLLSGHLGGANALTREIAGHLGAEAVITTASDVQGKAALDLWAEKENLYVEDYERLKMMSMKIVNGKSIRVRSAHALYIEHIPGEFRMVGPDEKADIIITSRIMKEDALYLRPRNLFVGIGCNRGTSKDEIRETARNIFEREMLSQNSIGGIASIDLKKDEHGLLDFARDEGLHIDFFRKDDLNSIVSLLNMSGSDIVKAATGAAAVAEPAAVLAAKKRFHNGTIIIPKEKRGNVTLAIAKAEFTL